MRLDWAILANAAEVRENLVNVLSAGWNITYREQYPALFFGAIAARILLHPSELLSEHNVQVQVSNAQGNVIHTPVGIRVPAGVAPPGAYLPMTEVPITVAINLTGLPVPVAGGYFVNLLADGFHLKSIPIEFVQGGPPAASSAILGLQGPGGS